MENEQRGRALRASSTSSLGREVRCGCQFYQSDSLLPERCALIGRPPSRSTMQTPTSHVRVQHPGEHEYELIASPPPPPAPAVNMVAPVVRITDTDVMPVADSDDSIDDRGRYNLRLTLDGDIILPLDGKIEDSAMAGRELGETIDTSDEMESEQIPEKLDSLAKAPDPDLEVRIKEEIIPSQISPPEPEDENQKEEEKKQTSHSFQEKLRIQADKLSSRFKGFHRPTFTMPTRHKSSKKESTPIPAEEKSKTQKASRMERFKMALPERPRFFTGTSKLNLKKRPKVNIKRPNIHLPSVFTRSLKRSPSLQEQKQRSNKSSFGSHKNIFNFSTYPRIFDKKAKNKAEYTTSSPKETRAHVTDSATYPRSKVSLRSRWGRKYEQDKFLDEEDQKVALERTRPWRHPSLEEPRLAFRIQASESLEESEKLPWDVEPQRIEYQEEIQYADYEEGSQNSDPLEHGAEPEEEEEEIDVRLLRLKQIEAFEKNGSNEDSIPPMILEHFKIRKMSYEENSPGPSNTEQQSSGSSYEKHRQDVIHEISDNFSFQEGDSHDDICIQRYLTGDLQDVHKTVYSNSLSNFDATPIPPQRPSRTRSLKKRKEKFFESIYPQSQSKSEQILPGSDDSLKNITGSFSKSAHRIVYRAETLSREASPADHLDDIIVVKPTRRKSKTSLRSQSEAPVDKEHDTIPVENVESFPPTVPRRRKRILMQNSPQKETGINFIYNGQILRNSLLEHASIDSENKENICQNLEMESFPPVPPKRRSRTASLFQDDEHSGDMIPGIQYIEDIPQIDSQSSGYAVIEKPEKSPRPFPPRRRRFRSATTTRPTAPKRPQRAYSTLGPSRKIAPEDASRSSENVSRLSVSQEDVIQYAKIDSEEHKNFKSEVLSKVQSRPLPAPPRPPRSQRISKTSPEYYEPESTQNGVVASTQNKLFASKQNEAFVSTQNKAFASTPNEAFASTQNEAFASTQNEAVASTQTDPLPDDIVIDEEITQAKLVMTPSRYGSQVLISTERIPTPCPSPQMRIHSYEDSDSTHSKEVPDSVLSMDDQDFVQSMDDQDVVPSMYEQNLVQSMDDQDVVPSMYEQDLIQSKDDQFHSTKIPDSLHSIPVPKPRIPDSYESKIPNPVQSKRENDEKLKESIQDPGAILRTVLLSDEPLRINNLEVGDLRVDRLSVSQLEAFKIAASEIDAIVVSASEMTGEGSIRESGINPALLQELVAIRSHLETVAQERPRSRTEDASTATSNQDISMPENVSSAPASGNDEKTETNKQSPEILQTQVLQVETLKPESQVQASFVSSSRESSREKDEKHDRRERRRRRRSRSRTASCEPTSVQSARVTSLDTPDTRRETASEKLAYLPQRTNTSHTEFQTSQIPAQFFSLASPVSQPVETEPSITETTVQLFRAIRIVGTRNLRHFVDYLASRVGREEASDKIREVELVLCALLLIVAGLLIMLFGCPRTVTHHYHWDYFNPPQ